MKPARLIGALAAGAVLAATPAVAAARPAGDGAPPSADASQRARIIISGSTSVAPLAAQLIRGYLRANPGSARFTLLQGGSDIGIADVARGRVTIGASSRDPLPGDPGGLVFSRIARDGVCIVTSPRNRIGNLSQEQVQAIFSGRVRSWRDVPGAAVAGPIQLTVRSPASGTQDAFKNIFMGPNLNVASSAQQRASNGLVQQSVRANANAIGYVDFRFTGGTNIVSYKGVACNLRNAKSGQYGGVRNFYFVTRGAAKGVAASFIRWSRTSGAARRIISRNWVPRS